MTQLNDLRREHSELINLSGRVKSNFKSEGHRALADILDLRDQITTKLTEHLTKEDGEFYPACFADSDETVSALAVRLADEMGTLGAWWNSFVADWTPDNATERFDSFRADMLHILAALEVRIGLEERQLFPAVEAAKEAVDTTGARELDTARAQG